MDDQRFDELTKALATGTSRRAVLKALGGSIASGLLGLAGARGAAARGGHGGSGSAGGSAGGGSSGGGGGGGGCRGLGQACAASRQCCSGVCAGG